MTRISTFAIHLNLRPYLSGLFAALQRTTEELFMTGPDVDIAALEGRAQSRPPRQRERERERESESERRFRVYKQAQGFRPALRAVIPKSSAPWLNHTCHIICLVSTLIPH